MPDVTVIADDDRWIAQLGGEPVGELRAQLRPDGRRFLRLPSDPAVLEPLLTAALADLDRTADIRGTTGTTGTTGPADNGRSAGAVCAIVDTRDGDAHRVLTGAGFVEVRREGTYRIPVPAEPPAVVVADGVDVVSAGSVDLDRLRLLDDELREDIPGSAGWRWTPEQFRAETLDDPAFDPLTYLVAVDRATGAYVGLVRVWMNREPRVGCVAVLPAYRRTRVTAALLTAVLAELARRGVPSMIAEVSDGNRAPLALLARAGARRTSIDVELVRPIG